MSIQTKHPPHRCRDVLETIGCDDFEIGLLPVLRHLCVSAQKGDPKSWSRAFDIAVERYGETTGLPAAHGLYKIVLSVFACRAGGLEVKDPLDTHARKDITDDEVQTLSMVHHMRRDNSAAARSAVAFVTRGRMDPVLIRAGLTFANRFPAGIGRQARRVVRPKLSVVA
ncbi:hypothetical protein [Shimia sagamensis]|uniref:Uncharacterized protein n=1 Tax=Shimia sagamensis TaxID=1566352 RepID=A0ABY1N7G7_9RHOB|nr:hypothetical protein [Shimia sagamensis]SMP02282.1 hypothetical protein SAMN06265373_101228 [Shimia sagamensis]